MKRKLLMVVLSIALGCTGCSIGGTSPDMTSMFEKSKTDSVKNKIMESFKGYFRSVTNIKVRSYDDSMIEIQGVTKNGMYVTLLATADGKLMRMEYEYAVANKDDLSGSLEAFDKELKTARNNMLNVSVIDTYGLLEIWKVPDEITGEYFVSRGTSNSYESDTLAEYNNIVAILQYDVENNLETPVLRLSLVAPEVEE